MADAEEGFFARYWNGHGKLWKVFWLYGVVASMVLAAVFIGLGTVRAEPVWPLALMLLGFAGYTVWILVSVWRCAFNVANPVYGHLARGLTVAWTINAVLLVLFLEVTVLSGGGDDSRSPEAGVAGMGEEP